MDHMASKENGLDFDLESGGEAETSSEQEQHEGQSLDSGDKSQKKTLSRLRSGHFGRFILIEDSDGLLGTSKNILSNGDYDLDRMVSRVGEKAEGNFVEKKKVNEKRKKTSFNKKHPKPPRPPGGPSLDEADMKFVKEISDHARLRHKTRERLKALKKMKATKAPSSNIKLIAMIITIIFCLVIIFQAGLGCLLILFVGTNVFASIIYKGFHANKHKRNKKGFIQNDGRVILSSFGMTFQCPKLVDLTLSFTGPLQWSNSKIELRYTERYNENSSLAIKANPMRICHHSLGPSIQFSSSPSPVTWVIDFGG